MAFSCDKCGACCRHLELFGPKYAWLLDGATGACRYFDAAANLCAIYPVRPVICNIEMAWHIHFCHIPHEQYIAQNLLACGMLKKLSGPSEGNCHGQS